ncbi:MAG: glycosyltransferase [Lentisphaerae bacterium]|nr:glycosyltransferase [Lentisphaerota bacterium]
MNHNFPARWAGLDVTLCHDWLTGMRGGERVLELLCAGFPRAPIRTLIHNATAVSDTINAHPVQPSWLQHVPGIMRHYRMLLPAFPAAIASLPPAGGDLLISTSHCVAKGLRTRPGTRHLCYCFTPMRYAWTFHDEYFAGNPLKLALASPLLAALRRWDRAASPRVDHFVAISEHVRERIRRFYGRDADVVYPPVDTRRCIPAGVPHAGFDLIVSALVPYKRIDLAVQAYGRIGYPLKVVGIGGEMPRLRALAGPNVEFLGWLPDRDVLELYQRCRLLVFPGEEDFGIVPLEAQACGRPVVAFARGGALETIRDGLSGLFFKEQTEDALAAAVRQAAEYPWDPAAIRAHAETFGEDRFVRDLATSIDRCLSLP